MKIRKFNQILESNQLDKESIMALIQDLSDTYDLEYTLVEGYFSESSLKKGIWGDKQGLFKKPVSKTDKKCYKLIIELNKNKCQSINPGDSYPIFEPDRILEIIKALSMISRVTETYLQLPTNKINFFIISDEEINLDESRIYELYVEIKSKFDKQHSDFAYDTTITMEDNKIIIKSSRDNYTDRKLSLILKGIPVLTDFKMNKSIEPGYVYNIIEPK
jgi:hypothetical protein